MCQSKSEGGKRCAIHMAGSRAVITTAVATAKVMGEKVTRGDAEAVFRELRKEGKDLPAPSPDIVREFAETQRFQAAFNPDLTEAERRRVQHQWIATIEGKDEIDGATMHGWKYTGAEILRRARSKVTAVFAASVLSVSLVACSGSGGNIDTTPLPSASPTAITAEYTPADYGIDTGANINHGISASQETATDSHGTYHIVDIAEDSPAYNLQEIEYNPEVTAKYSQEQLDAMQKASADFVLKKVMDGPAVLDTSASQLQAQVNQTVDYIAPEYQKEYTDLTLGGDFGAVDGISKMVKQVDAVPVYSPETPRYSLVSISQAHEVILPNNGEGAVYYYHVINRRAVEYKDGSKGYIESDSHYGLTMLPTNQSEKPFEITGWLNQSEHTAYRTDGTILGSSES